MPDPARLGITIASYGHHWGSRRRGTPVPGWQSALGVLDHCHAIGAGCLQIGVGGWSDDFAASVRDRREALGITLEGQVRLPGEKGDVDRFDRDLRSAREAGAKTVRTVCLGGRRYETFDSLDAWKTFVAGSYAAVERAAPVAARHRVALAIENHKDWRTDEHLALLRHIDSEWVGVNFDFGNNLALLEDPVAAAETLAPYIRSTHVKDMALARSPGGFLLSEVPLGQGVLDLPRIIRTCRRATPDVQLNLEMITRDPLAVPVLGERYWTTMPGVLAADLARTLGLTTGRTARDLPSTSGRSPSDRLAFEEHNVRQSFDYARRHLGL